MKQIDQPIIDAPFPAMGGKKRIAEYVWKRLGADARSYVEPFAFSAAMLLGRPGGAGKVETINDLNAFVANFFRAVKADPDGVAYHADNPVNETDLHARHAWLVNSDKANARLQKVVDDPDFYDVKIAGWWCWGACCWIGSGWCTAGTAPGTRHPGLGVTQGVNAGLVGRPSVPTQVPHLTNRGGGVIADNEHMNQKRPKLNQPGRMARGEPSKQIPQMDPNGRLVASGATGGVSQQIPMLNPPNAHGVNSGLTSPQALSGAERPQLADAFSRGRGVNGSDAAVTCEDRLNRIRAWMLGLADRLRPVRVCCGHWSRICDSPSTMTRLGAGKGVAAFLDPPYRISIDGKKNRQQHIYANDKIQDVNALCDEVQEWCLKWGDDPRIRIVLCGLEGEYPLLEEKGWEVVPYCGPGGYGNRSAAGKANAARERLWCSPGCLPEDGPAQTTLFGQDG